MEGCKIIIVSILGVLAITPVKSDVEMPLGELYQETQKKLDRVSVSLEVNGTIDSRHIDGFIDNMTKDLNRMQNAMNNSRAPKLNMDKVGELLKKAIHEFERSNGNKNKRVLKDMVQTTKAGISVLGKAMKEFIEAMKPVRGEVAAVAADIQKSIGSAADKLLDVITKAG